MNCPKISIIIPIYNVEDYLEETLDSLLNQTIIDDIEVLMIDDGSTDNSRYIIEKYALDHDNFHAFHNENGGQGAARNFGLDHAKGEYIHFLDSDDLIIPDGFEKLYNVVSQGNYDFVVGNVYRFNRYNCREDTLFKNSLNGLKDKAIFSSINDHPSLVWDSSTSNKLYKKDFLMEKDIKFLDEKVFFEDLLFSMEIYCKADSFIFLDEYFYYWRYRDNKSSVTQQNNKNLKNFKDRLEITRLIQNLVEKYELTDSTLNALYEKWLVHDLRMYIKKINTYPLDAIDGLLDELLELLSVIPSEIKENLNSYSKIIYRMIENRDIDALLYFAPLEFELKKDPDMNLDLSDEYLSLIDFKKDSFDEELIVKKVGMGHDEENILIDFEEKIYYLPSKIPYELDAVLVDENNDESSLEISNGQIILPFDLVKDKNSLRIKMKCGYDSHCKESYLVNTKRESIIFDNFDFEFGLVINKVLVINVREVKDEVIDIEKISFEDDSFILEGSSYNRFDNVIIENVITFEKIEYPVTFNNHNFSFAIPYSDIVSSQIKKWELKSGYVMRVPNRITFFKQYHEIFFANTRNKILISDDVYDSLERLFKINNELIEANKDIRELNRENSKLTRKNTRLTKANSKLSNQNERLNETIEEFKSRKVVKAADKVKRIL